MKLLPISKSNNHELLAFQAPRVEGYEITNFIGGLKLILIV